MKATTATSVLVLLSHLAAYPAMADGIKDLVSDETLAAYCATVPLDSETTATLPGLDGTDVTGSIHCEAEDLVVGSDDDLDDDAPGTDDGTPDQGSGDVGEADDSGDDSGDDASDDGGDDSEDDSGDDDSGDDDSGEDDGGEDDSGGDD